MNRPNILIIITDQQSASMMSCAGNPWLRTPAMDSLASGGVRFSRAVCSNPVCVPSRFSLFTGRMPSEIGVRENTNDVDEDAMERIREQWMGRLVAGAGYRAVYGGKVHVPRMNVTGMGFECLTPDGRDDLAADCAEFLRGPHDRPFLLVASFVNPHDICYMAIREHASTARERGLMERASVEIEELDRAVATPEGVDAETFFAEHCPPLPDNPEPQTDEPEAVETLLNERPFRRNARDNWTERTWRMHRYAYARLTERVDGQIARVLDALRDSGRDEDTLVIFTSDHGDHDASHRLEHKTVLYREAVNVPLIVAGAGVEPAGSVDGEHLVSNGLDLLPTVCDYAGVEPPDDLRGASIRPLLEGISPTWRDAVPVESQLGRMVETRRHAYALYDDGARREQLYDLDSDPGQTRNFAGDADSADALERHRRLYAEQFPPRD